MSPATKPEPVVIRAVWADNLEAEFALIRTAAEHHPIAALDTEFPGVIHRPIRPHRLLSAADRYSLLKSNVDSLNLIQLGLTLSNVQNTSHLVWEFNFHDFDPTLHPHAPDSIELLKSHGINFDENRRRGIDTAEFGELLMSSGLVCNDSVVSWVTFHSCYDFGYLVKVLTRRSLPGSLGGFLELVRVFFGERVFDVKCMVRDFEGLFGGLERVASVLRVERVAGRCHQAGSDSLLTMMTFRRMSDLFFGKDEGGKYAGMLFGLEVY